MRVCLCVLGVFEGVMMSCQIYILSAVIEHHSEKKIDKMLMLSSDQAFVAIQPGTVFVLFWCQELFYFFIFSRKKKT